MTKCIVIGKTPENKESKPIEFVKFLNPLNFKFETSLSKPSEFNYLELVCRNYFNERFDLIFAYKKECERNNGSQYLGHWNDGFVK